MQSKYKDREHVIIARIYELSSPVLIDDDLDCEEDDLLLDFSDDDLLSDCEDSEES